MKAKQTLAQYLADTSRPTTTKTPLTVAEYFQIFKDLSKASTGAYYQALNDLAELELSK